MRTCISILSFFLFLTFTTESHAVCSQASVFKPQGWTYIYFNGNPRIISFYYYDQDRFLSHDFKMEHWGGSDAPFSIFIHHNFTWLFQAGIYKIYLINVNGCGKPVGPPILFRTYRFTD